MVAEARNELFAARYQNAATLYSKLLEQQPTETDAWSGLVRAELGLHKSREAYAAAEQGLIKAPESAGAQTAAGLATYRRGDLKKAEAYFRAALKIKPDYPPALKGLASFYSAVSMFRSARDMILTAYKLSPEDPELIVSRANTLKGAEHITALEAALRKYDPASEEARALRTHIANDRAMGDRQPRRLISPYESSQLKLLPIMNNPLPKQRRPGVSLLLKLNEQTITVLLDTGASGIAITPNVAERVGLKLLNGVASQARGIGDQKAAESTLYLASELRAGNVVFADYPISVSQSFQVPGCDGIIGADVFRQFLVKIDFLQMKVGLEPRPEGNATSDEPIDWTATPPPGFHRVFRVGSHLLVPTSVNGKDSTLFLVDSGSTENLIDTEMAWKSTSVNEASGLSIKGAQGDVSHVSRADDVSLVFAGFRYGNPAMTAISLEKAGDSAGVGFEGILGMPILGQLIVTIDYRSGIIRFEAP